MVSDLGKLLDPIADKFLQICVILSVVISGKLPWAVIGLFAVKETLQIVGSALLYRDGVVLSARWFGKASTFIITVCLIYIIVFPDAPQILLNIFAAVISLCIILSFILYVNVYFETLKKLTKESSEN